MPRDGVRLRKDFSVIVEGFEKRNCKLLITKDQYVNGKQSLPYICNEHIEKGTQYARWDNFRTSTTGCRYCSYVIRGKKHRTDFAVIEKAFEDRGYALLSKPDVYEGNLTSLAYICPKHEKEGIQHSVWSDFNSGCGCYHCGREKVAELKWKYTLEFFQEKFSKRGYKLLNKTYEGYGKRAKYICEKHPTKIQEVQYDNFNIHDHGCKFCYEENKPRGENHPLWKGTSSEYEQIRKSREYIAWKVSVLRRDKHTCQCCGSKKGKKLRAHHINSFANFPDLRLEVFNGITLCEDCHENKIPGSLHHTYGCFNVTEAQLYEYLAMRKEELSHAN